MIKWQFTPKLIFLGIGLVCLFAAGLLVGEVSLPISAYGDAFTNPQSFGAEILWSIRLPRLLTAAIIGALLGLSGAIMQGFLRNPLAEPGLLGVSAGAGLGAALAIVLGFALIPGAIEVLALMGALIASLILAWVVHTFAQRHALILMGVGLSSLMGALMSLLFNLSPSPIATKDVLDWMLGSVEGRHWGDVLLGIGVLIPAGFILHRFGQGLRLLTLGEDTAATLGLNWQRFGLIMLLTASALTGVSVAIAGLVSFIGLVAPHIVRGFGLKDPAHLLWPSALVGSVLVVLADLLVRLIPASGDVRLGVLTALIGAPLFAFIANQSAKSWGDGG
jgi:iron complex transport system permease protein